MSFFPLVSFDKIELEDANRLLVQWGHKMGPLERGNEAGSHFALYHHGRPVAVAMASSLIRECVGGGLGHMTRADTVELSRLCAERKGLCRVAVRLWREYVLPDLTIPGAAASERYAQAISYQDADLHNGNTYRFDGWKREAFSSSGTDQRSGKKGRRKWIWVWRVPAAMAAAAEQPEEATA